MPGSCLRSIIDSDEYIPFPALSQEIRGIQLWNSLAGPHTSHVMHNYTSYGTDLDDFKTVGGDSDTTFHWQTNCLTNSGLTPTNFISLEYNKLNIYFLNIMPTLQQAEKAISISGCVVGGVQCYTTGTSLYYSWTC